MSITENEKQQIESMIQNGYISRYLYKFRSFDQHFDDIIKKNQLWFSKPFHFNDPFDCRVFFSSKKSTLNDLEKFFDNDLASNAFRSIYPDDEFVDVMKEVASKLSFFSNETLIKASNQALENILHRMGICCFSKNWRNILQWSHYSDGHRGLVLKFDILKDLPFFWTPSNVIYTKEFPMVDILNGEDKDNTIKMFLTKALDWSYEEEVRVVKSINGNHHFLKPSLIEIIFGVTCEQNQLERVKELTANHGYSQIKFYKAVKKEREYGLNKEELFN